MTRTVALLATIAVTGCGGSASTTGEVPGPSRAMPTLGPTTKLPDLLALGLDPKQLPGLHDIPTIAMKPLMETFDDSLDACCEDCHVKNDPRAPTKAKRISGEMWRRFTQELVTRDGSPVYCDSCHRGTLRFLDRRDPAALRAWMRDNYVAGLRKRDGGAVECATCHGEPFEPKLIERLWQTGGEARR